MSHKLTANCKRGKNKRARLRVCLTEEVRLCSQRNERCERRNGVSVKWRHNSIVLIDCTRCQCHSNTTTSEVVKPCQKTFQQRWKGEHDNKENGLLCVVVCVFLSLNCCAQIQGEKLIFLFSLLLCLICILEAGGFLNCFIRTQHWQRLYLEYIPCLPCLFPMETHRDNHTRTARLSCLITAQDIRESFWLHLQRLVTLSFQVQKQQFIVPSTKYNANSSLLQHGQ